MSPPAPAAKESIRPARTPAGRLLQRAVPVQPDEIPRALAAAAWFFLLLTSYFVLRPIRDAMGVAGGVDNIKWLWNGTFAVTLLVTPLFAWAATRLPRRVLVPRTYHFVALNLLAFWALWQLLPEYGRVWIGRAFYVWVSVFNLFVVSVLWSVLTDLFRADQAKRLFGFIGVGGTLGGVTGAGVTALFAESVGTDALLLVSAALVELGLVCAVVLMRGARAADAAIRGDDAPPGRSVLHGLAQIWRSAELRAISGYVLLLTFASTVLYMEKVRLVAGAFPTRDAQTAFFARLDLWTQLAVAVVQVLLTERVLRRLGVGFTLCTLPVACALGFALLGTASALGLSVFWIFVAFDVTRNATRHALAKPAREVLFTLVDREARYASKNAIDVVVYRGGDLANAFVHAGIRAVVPSIAGVAFVAVPFALAWTALGAWLGRGAGRRR